MPDRGGRTRIDEAAAVQAAGGTLFIIARRTGGTTLSNGEKTRADGHLDGAPLVLFDEVALIRFEEASQDDLHSAAVQFAMVAVVHQKAIGSTPGARPLLNKPGVEADDGVSGLGSDFVDATKRRFFGREDKVRALP